MKRFCIVYGGHESDARTAVKRSGTEVEGEGVKFSLAGKFESPTKRPFLLVGGYGHFS